jgi:hypothetical protein
MFSSDGRVVDEKERWGMKMGTILEDTRGCGKSEVRPA